ncbi:MAG: GNAT family N-acetyltransferase [Solirubrobacteraceae bacterium]
MGRLSHAALIRGYRPQDEDRVVELSLQAWAPVFASLEQRLGRDIFGRLHRDWRQDQAAAVRSTLADGAMRVWLAEADRRVVAFVAATLHRETGIGEICMLAVAPEDQNDGLGTALTHHATDWLLAEGMRVAMVETGGDPGHAPARSVYERAGYTLLPVARYFKAI